LMVLFFTSTAPRTSPTWAWTFPWLASCSLPRRRGGRVPPINRAPCCGSPPPAALCTRLGLPTWRATRRGLTGVQRLPFLSFLLAFGRRAGLRCFSFREGCLRPATEQTPPPFFFAFFVSAASVPFSATRLFLGANWALVPLILLPLSRHPLLPPRIYRVPKSRCGFPPPFPHGTFPRFVLRPLGEPPWCLSFSPFSLTPARRGVAGSRSLPPLAPPPSPAPPLYP